MRTLFILLLTVVSAFGQTMTVGTRTQNSAISSGTTYAATNSSAFKYYGFSVTNYSGSMVGAAYFSDNNLSMQPPIQASFTVTGTNCEVIVNCDSWPTAGLTRIAFWEFTDGTTTSAYTNDSLGNGPYNTAYVPVAFSTGGTHKMRVSIHGNFGGVRVPTGQTVSAYQITPKPNLLIVLGDSYTQGYSPNAPIAPSSWPSYWFDGWVWKLGKLSSNTIAIPSGLGGTGFVRTNQPNGWTNYVSRVTHDIVPVYQAAVSSGLYSNIFFTASGTINDDGYDTNVLYSNATNVYKLIQINCPMARRFVLGNWYANYGHVQANETNQNNTLKRVATDLGLTYFSPVEARLLDPISTGNWDVFMGSDSVHPKPYGYQVMAQWMNTNLVSAYGELWVNSATNAAPTNAPVADVETYLPIFR